MCIRDSFYGVGFIIFYVVPFVVTIVLYSRIIKSLNQSRHTLEGEQPHQKKLRRAHQQNRAVMKIFLLIVSASFICWTPLCVYIVLKKINPVILFLSSTWFSMAFNEMFNSFTRNSSLCCQSRRVAPDL